MTQTTSLTTSTLESNPNPPVIHGLRLDELLSLSVNPGAGSQWVPLRKWLPLLLAAMWDENDGAMRGKATTFGKDARTLKADVIRALIGAHLVRGSVDMEGYVRHYDHEAAAAVIRAIVAAAFRDAS